MQMCIRDRPQLAQDLLWLGLDWDTGWQPGDTEYTQSHRTAVYQTAFHQMCIRDRVLAYAKTKPARDGRKAQKTEKARSADRERHESDFIIADAATRYFRAHGVSKLPRDVYKRQWMDRSTQICTNISSGG